MLRPGWAVCGASALALAPLACGTSDEPSVCGSACATGGTTTDAATGGGGAGGSAGASGYAGTSGTAGSAGASGSGGVSYSIPATQAGRIGLYAWGFDPAPLGSSAPLDWAREEAKALGTRAVRVAMAPNDPYSANPSGAFSLVEAAKSPGYAALFADAAFDTILLTVYSQSDFALAFSDGLSAQEAADARAEIADLGEHLLSTYDNKRFIVLNWEGDNQLDAFAGNAVAWQGFSDWIAARTAGVEDARQAVSGSTSQLFSGLELNRIQGCGTTKKCVVSDVAPYVAVDYYSYSSWESLADEDPSKIGPQLTADLDAALGLVQAKRPEVGKERFLVGEFGAARDVPFTGECASAARSMAAVDALEKWGAALGIFWQLGDNVPGSGTWLGFGLVQADGTHSLSYDAFADLYAKDALPVVSTAGCPLISPGGIISTVTKDATFHPNEILELYGAGFSTSGDVVQVRQNGVTHAVSAGSPYFYDSPGQLNFQLPSAIGTGQVVVYVTRGDGVDSNGQLLTVIP